MNATMIRIRDMEDRGENIYPFECKTDWERHFLRRAGGMVVEGGREAGLTFIYILTGIFFFFF